MKKINDLSLALKKNLLKRKAQKNNLKFNKESLRKNKIGKSNLLPK